MDEKIKRIQKVLVEKYKEYPEEIANLDLNDFMVYINEKVKNQPKLMSELGTLMYLTIVQILKDSRKEVFEFIIGFLHSLETKGIINFDKDFKKVEDLKELIIKFQQILFLEKNIFSYDKKDQEKYLTQLNESYCTFYETVLNDLKYYAEKIKNREIISKGEIIRALKEYDDCRYQVLFEVFNNNIRNAISHKTFYLDKTKRFVTYIDREKIVKLNIDELHKYIDVMFNLHQLFILAEFGKQNNLFETGK